MCRSPVCQLLYILFLYFRILFVVLFPSIIVPGRLVPLKVFHSLEASFFFTFRYFWILLDIHPTASRSEHCKINRSNK